MIIEIREASWTAPALWRFARKRKIRRISAALFCANDNMNCYSALVFLNSISVSTFAPLHRLLAIYRSCAFALKSLPNQAKTVPCLFFATRLILTP